jgi:hypothetical protein
MVKENWNRKGSAKGNTSEKIRRGGQAKKITKTVKVLYWNVAGLRKKEQEFWDYVRQLAIVGLVETWI